MVTLRFSLANRRYLSLRLANLGPFLLRYKTVIYTPLPPKSIKLSYTPPPPFPLPFLTRSLLL